MRVLKNILNIVNDEYYFKVILFNMFNIFSYQKNAQDRLMMKILWQRLTITKRRLKPKEIVELNRKYEEDSENLQVPIVKSYVETIDTLLNTNKSLLRYGDGEFNLIFGEDIPFQRFSKELAFRLKEIIVSNDDNELKTKYNETKNLIKNMNAAQLQNEERAEVKNIYEQKKSD